MPLFFLIAIGAGALTVGATTVDTIGDNKETRAQAQAQQQSQQQAFNSMEECKQAMLKQGVPETNCRQRS